ncbi:PAS domain-containing protein [Halobacillus massiliensis]|uniref:PAS domain-containing protein n=1 Tax=Halobacillus massiliensis TaxID=1926286 RepID=UPI0009E298DB|nr:STAS domain-containing protein [Halobacillus massiliensis]
MEYKTVEYLNEIQQNEFIKAAIDRVGAGVVISDPEQPDNPIIYINKGFEELTGYEADEVIGLNCRFLQGKNTDEKDVQTIREHLNNLEPVELELLNYKKDGTPFWNDLQIFPVYIEPMEQTYFVGVQKDISKRKDAEFLVGHYTTEVKRLSTPIVPVEDNVSVLPLIGTVDEERVQQMLDFVGHHVQESKEDYIILDLSAVHTFNEDIHVGIYRLGQLLTLMGTKLLVTGVKPNFAMQSTPYVNFNELDLKAYTTVNQALKDIR